MPKKYSKYKCTNTLISDRFCFEKDKVYEIDIERSMLKLTENIDFVLTRRELMFFEEV